MSWLVFFAAFAAAPLLAMGLVWLVGLRRAWLLLVAAALGGALAGAFLAAAGSAMASAVSPGAAMTRGGGFGLVIGMTVGSGALAARSLLQGRKRS